MAENVIALRTSLHIDPWTGTEFCDWLKGHYTHVIEASFNPGRKIFIIEGLNVSNQTSVFLEDLNCFVARKSAEFHEDHGSSSNSDAISSESWDCSANFDPDRHAPFLRRIGDLTGTRITFDEFSQQLVVVAKDEASVKETIVRLNHLQAALSLLMANKAKRQHHHIFLPASGYNKLQLVPFKQHPSANTVRTVMTPTDWRSITVMGVLMPSRQGVAPVAPQLTSANPRAFVASRFFSSERFREFRNASMYDQTLSSAESRASSIESMATSTFEALQTFPPTRPKDYENLLLSDRTDRITSWVNQSTSKETNVPAIHDMELVPLAEYPPEQKPVKGLLRRRAKQTNAAPTVPEQAAATGHVTSSQSSQVTWEPLKPKAGSDFSRTTGQKTSPDSRKQVKQATLHTFWPKSSAGLKSLVSQTEECADAVPPGAQMRGTPCDSIQQTEEKMKTPTVNSQPPKDFAEVDEIFNVLRPILEKARSFPGMLQLEAHIQLATIALNGKVGTEILTSQEWKQILQFKDPIHRPSFFLWEKLTGSGGDIDSAIDLTWSKTNPKRLFQQTPADDGIVYEFLCQMNDGSNFVISLDENGRPSFNECTTELAWSTVHFPHRMWDVNLVLNGAMELQSYQDPSIKVVLDEFVRSIYFQPGSNLIIFCNQPADRTFTVQKILMKRWMRHRYTPLNQVMHSDLLLKTVEVHEFLIARKEGHHTLLRGRIPLDDRKKCVEEKKLWYEMSIVCDRIQKMLSTNRELELGQKNEHWCAGDFLREQNLSTHEEDASAASGSSGIDGMYRLAKTVLDRMKFGE